METYALPLLLALIALTSAVVVAIAKFYPVLRDSVQGYPYEREIEAALLPFLYQAIAAAYRTSERGVDEVKARMDGVDKAAVANMVYDLLPDYIVVAGRIIPLGVVKQLVPRTRFQTLVELAYVEFSEFYELHTERFDAAFEAWMQANQPPTPAELPPSAG